MIPASFYVRSENFGGIPLSKSIPDDLISQILPGALPWVASSPSGYFLLQEIKGKDYSAWYITILLQQDDQLIITVNQSFLSLQFFLQNDVLLTKLATQEQLSFPEGEYNMSSLSHIEFKIKVLKSQPCKCLTLIFPNDYLHKIALAYPFLAELFEKSNPLPLPHLYSSNGPITEEMKRSLETLLYCPSKIEEARSAIQRGKMWELLHQVLDHASRRLISPRPTLSQKDTESIYLAKEYLDQHYCTPITLFQLAQKVGVNVHKLSAGFLQIIGTTVFYYKRQIRMLKAKQMLEETDRDLFDIGTEIGYADGKCFSKEFKKDKGITPMEYRRQFRMLHR